VADESLAQLLTRLNEERREADRLYNDALTALDRALEHPPDLPGAPPAYDETRLAVLNREWNILPAGAPALDRSFKGRLRGLVWRLVGPALEGQLRFNSALVDHLNRNVAAHHEAEQSLAGALTVLRHHLEHVTHFQNHLIRYLQTITLYVDTRDRATAGQARVVNAGLDAVAADWLLRWETLEAREARYDTRHTALTAAYAELKDQVAIAQQSALTLKREVERLIAGGPGARPAAPAVAVDLESFTYVGFEDRFRGSRETIRERLSSYVPLFAGAEPVLELGCGRGEFLDLLREQGISGRGVDSNHEMVEVSRGRGLDANEGDALAFLDAQPDESLGGVFAAQVIEHLPPGYLMTLLETAGHKLRQGGRIVLETINPTCWAAFFESYLRDLTHVRPIHPETLQYLLRASGFRDVTIEYSSPIADWDRLRPAPTVPADGDPALVGLIDAYNDSVAKLNGRLFGYQDYAAVARR
jgi:SAM-dependent methyltransferase